MLEAIATNELMRITFMIPSNDDDDDAATSTAIYSHIIS